jgi:hypothetical protein
MMRLRGEFLPHPRFVSLVLSIFIILLASYSHLTTLHLQPLFTNHAACLLLDDSNQGTRPRSDKTTYRDLLTYIYRIIHSSFSLNPPRNTEHSRALFYLLSVQKLTTFRITYLIVYLTQPTKTTQEFYLPSPYQQHTTTHSCCLIYLAIPYFLTPNPTSKKKFVAHRNATNTVTTPLLHNFLRTDQYKPQNSILFTITSVSQPAH